MAKKLINRTIFLILLSLFIKYLLPIYTVSYDVSYFSTNLPDHVLKIRVGTILLIIVLLVRIFMSYLMGEYDKFLKNKVDPHLKKICDYLNRRNGGCDE